MYLPEPNESNFTPLAAGTYTATCYRFIDKGTHQTEYQGQQKTRREIMIGWEIANEFMDDGKPFTISKTYTWSMAEKATLRKDLEAWRGKPFVADDFKGPNRFNTKKLIGVPCTLTVSAQEGRDGKEYTKVTAVGQVMKGMKPPALINRTAYLSLDAADFDRDVFNDLSDKLRETIAKSPEYLALTQGEYSNEYRGADRAPEDQDIPF